MNSEKTSNYGKIIAFFLIASVLLCILGFAAEGWQTEPNDDIQDNTSVILPDDDKNEDIGTGGNNEENVLPGPIFINPLTGLESTPMISATRPVAFTVDSGSPVYGLGYADILIEFPTETGSTRYLGITGNYRAIGKIGSIAPSRGFINNLAAYFGAILISAGMDDTVEYNYVNNSSYQFDITATSGYHYTEYTHLKYTNGALIEAGIKNTNINSVISNDYSLPFDFADEIEGSAIVASQIAIPITSEVRNELIYSPENNEYILIKNGESRIDLLSEAALGYENVFVLFSDCMTYESSNGVELIMDTVTSGLGYYAVGGTLSRIQWRVNDGELKFYDDDGEPLKALYGRSYISYIKSSKIDSVVFS